MGTGPRKAKRKKGNQKIDIGVPMSEVFSRKHLKVVEMSPLQLRQMENVIREIRVYKFNRQTRSMSRLATRVKRGEQFELQAGDCVYITDAFVFRVVRVNQSRKKNRPAIIDLCGGGGGEGDTPVIDLDTVDKQSPVAVGGDVELDSGSDVEILTGATTSEPIDDHPGEPDSSESDGTNGINAVKSEMNEEDPSSDQYESDGTDDVHGHKPDDLDAVKSEPKEEDPFRDNGESDKSDQIDECKLEPACLPQEEELDFEKPQIGEEFRVRFKTRVEYLDKTVESWSIGRVVGFQKTSKSFQVELIFADGISEFFYYPSNDIQLVDSKSDNRFIYADLPDGEKEIAVDKNPEAKDLSMGDLVDGFYQNGADDGRWFRGRIAAISEHQNTLAIRYDDGEVRLPCVTST